MENALTTSNIEKFLNYVFDNVRTENLGIDSAKTIALKYKKEFPTYSMQCDNLIKTESEKAALSGFVTGLGGAITMPITIPANISSLIILQIRMILAIAYLGGYDLNDKRVRTMVFMALLGKSSSEELKKIGIKVGKQITYELIKKIPDTIIVEINKKVGFKLITKFGEKGLINLGKMVPLVGGMIGGSIDYSQTKTIGLTAKKLFAS